MYVVFISNILASLIKTKNQNLNTLFKLFKKHNRNCMKNLYSSKVVRLALSVIFLLGASTAFSQLKIGSNPTQIQKSSILELESDRQGFLLPRLTDTTQINSLTPPDGMLIYFTPNNNTGKGLYIRKSGIWQRFTTDSVALDKWSKTGDVLVGNEKLGSLNAQTLRMITNNVERMTIDASTGNVVIENNAQVKKDLNVNQILNVTLGANVGKSLIVGDTTTSRRLIVTDSVQFKNLNASTDLNEILVIDVTTGAIRRRAIAADQFKNWVVGAFKNTANANGLSRNIGTVSDTLVLHAATAATPGGVSTTTQTFGGSKTFQDSVMAAKTLSVGSTTNANSTLQVTGSVAMSIRTVSATTTLGNTDYTVLVNAAGGAVSINLPAPAASIAGRIYIVKKIAGGLNNDVIVNGPIEDGTSMSLYNDWTVLKVQTDGSRWFVIK
ncbi:MAG: hypothetical protein JWQ96_2483 [Segetibacter sp.]|nr:hypothetical protein [Segetibacter sp.]